MTSENDVTDAVETESDQTEATPVRPMLRIVGGNPSDEDVAVLVAVLGSASGGADKGPPAERELWGSPAARLRPPWPLASTSFPNLTFGP